MGDCHKLYRTKSWAMSVQSSSCDISGSSNIYRKIRIAEESKVTPFWLLIPEESLSLVFLFSNSPSVIPFAFLRKVWCVQAWRPGHTPWMFDFPSLPFSHHLSWGSLNPSCCQVMRSPHSFQQLLFMYGFWWCFNTWFNIYLWRLHFTLWPYSQNGAVQKMTPWGLFLSIPKVYHSVSTHLSKKILLGSRFWCEILCYLSFLFLLLFFRLLSTRNMMNELKEVHPRFVGN